MDAVIDFETLGINSCNCVVVSCALTFFEFDRFSSNPYTFQELLSRTKLWNFEIRHQVELGWKIDKDTLEWWKSQSTKPNFSKGDTKTDQFSHQIFNIFQKMKPRALWCRGSNFDHVILKRIVETNGFKLDDMIHYTGYRDIRTFIDTLTGLQKRPITTLTHLKDTMLEFKAHDPVHDVAFDIYQMQKTIRAIEGKD